jgi:uncharacterized protein YkwD
MKWSRVAALSCLALGGSLWASEKAVPIDDTAARNQVVTLDHLDVALLGREIFRATNLMRRAHHLPQFKPETRVTAAADDQAALMAMILSCQHTNPLHGQGNVMERVMRRGFEAALVRENVALTPLREANREQPERTYAQVAADIVQQWMDSPDHRANLLSRDVIYLGCAVRGSLLPVGHEEVFAAQVFATPRQFPAFQM